MGDPIIDAEERLRIIESEERLRRQVEGRTVQAPGPVAPPFPVQPAPPTDQFPDIAPPGLANPPLFLTPAPPPQQDPQSFFGNLMGVLGTPGEAVLGVLGGIPELPKLPFIPETVQGMGGRFLGSLIGMGPEEINTFAENNAKAWSVISGNSFDIAFFDLKSKLEQLAQLSRERPPTEQVISAAAEIAAGISAGKAIVGGVKAVTKRVAPEVAVDALALVDRPQVVQKLAQEIPTLKRMEAITAKATREAIGAKAVAARETVSYTHLTLPTKRIV